MAVRQPRWALALVLASLWLTACGDAMTLKVSAQSLTFAEQGGYTPGSQRITGTIDPLNEEVYVGVLCSGNGVGGCIYDISTHPFTVEVIPKSVSELPNGTYQDEVIIAVCKDEACEEHISGSPLVVPVSYTVHHEIRFQPESLSFTAVLGSSVRPSQTHVRYHVPFPFEWKASADRGWIQLPIAQGANGFDSGFPVEVDPWDLAVGSHSGTITLANLKTGDTHPLPVTLELRPATLSAEPQALVLGGADGTDTSAQRLAVSFDTGTTAYGWRATVDTGSGPRWLKLSKSSGTASSTPAELTVSADLTGLHGGTYSGSVTFTATVQGQSVSKTVPVSLRLAEHALWAPENGVALVSTPSFSRLTQTVTLKDSWGLSTTPWTAQSNQPWLKVTPGGTTGEPLTLTATPDGLASDTLHSATVTLGSSDGSVTRGETIQVGLWVGSSASNSRDRVYGSPVSLEVDPIRPYVYVRERNGGLAVYNVHTAALLTRLTTIPAGPMAFSSDGSTLYVLDDSRRIVPVDLRTLTAGTPWDTGLASASSIHYARPSGHGVLLINGNHLFDASTGVPFPPVTNGLTQGLTFGRASKDGALFCGQGSYYSSRSTVCWSLSYSNLDGGRVTLTRRGFPDVAHGSVTDVAISPDGNRVYSSVYNFLGLAVFDGKTLERRSMESWGSGSGSALAVGPQGHVYEALGTYVTTGAPDLFVSDSEGSVVGSFRMASGFSSYIQERQLRVSSDGKRLVAITSGGGLEFATVP